jgi:hypothetical protein
MKWIIHLYLKDTGEDLTFHNYDESEPTIFDLDEAVQTVEILMKPSMFGNKELYNITLEPIKEI